MDSIGFQRFTSDSRFRSVRKYLNILYRRLHNLVALLDAQAPADARADCLHLCFFRVFTNVVRGRAWRNIRGIRVSQWCTEHDILVSAKLNLLSKQVSKVIHV